MKSIYTQPYKITLGNLDGYYIDELVDIRSKARYNKDWELVDRLRNYLDTKSVIIMDTKGGQEVYYLTKNQTREDLVNRINKDKKALSMHESWLYSIRLSADYKNPIYKKDHKIIKKDKNYKEIDGILLEITNKNKLKQL